MMLKEINIISISGHDPSSGAGIAQDIKIATKLNTHIATVPTCLTQQNSTNFYKCNDVCPKIIENQVRIICEDIRSDIIVKIGLLPNVKIIDKVNQLLENDLKKINVILDPVIKSTTSKKILNNEQIQDIKYKLLNKVYLLTPNINEAEILTNTKIRNLNDIKKSAIILKNFGVKNILIKGGHFDENSDNIIHFLLLEDNSSFILNNKRIKNKTDIRGTGCALATAICCYLSKGYDLKKSVSKANIFVVNNIKKAKKIGSKLLII